MQRSAGVCHNCYTIQHGSQDKQGCRGAAVTRKRKLAEPAPPPLPAKCACGANVWSGARVCKGYRRVRVGV